VKGAFAVVLFAMLALSACWAGRQALEIATAPLADAPSVAVRTPIKAQREAFCRVLRESGRFRDVDCSDDPHAEATLELRYVTTSFEHETGKAIGYGFASVFNCIWFAKVAMEQEHRAVLKHAGREDNLKAVGRANLQKFFCFPVLGIVTLFGNVWAPLISMGVSWERVEQKCADAPIVGVGVAVGNVAVASAQRDTSMCDVRDLFVTETATNAAVAMLPSLLERLKVPAAAPVSVPPRLAPAPRAPPGPSVPPPRVCKPPEKNVGGRCVHTDELPR
jgi:hypothetical protein